jgi:hypothetical protein
MKVPITVLNVTLMGAFRSDAHVGTWSYPPTVLDCSHWCLPGVPDAWNELVFSYLLTNGELLSMLRCFFFSMSTVREKVMFFNQTVSSYHKLLSVAKYSVIPLHLLGVVVLESCRHNA